MEQRFKDRVVLITGAARGQGRSHALAFAREGADIVICDIAEQVDAAAYPLATEDDLAETQRLVEENDRQCLAMRADTRDTEALAELVSRAHDQFGKIDVLCANAGIAHFAPVLETPQSEWEEVLGINLTGTWNSIRAVLPGMIDKGFGRIVVTTSSVSRHPVPGIAAYLVAKTGLVALVKTVSMEHFKQGVTTNAIAPYNCGTEMIFNDANYKVWLPDVENPTKEEAIKAFGELSPHGDPYVEPEDVTDGILFLASDAAKKISGLSLDVQSGWNAETMV